MTVALSASSLLQGSSRLYQDGSIGGSAASFALSEEAIALFSHSNINSMPDVTHIALALGRIKRKICRANNVPFIVFLKQFSEFSLEK